MDKHLAEKKKDRLAMRLRELGSLIVAFSGGLDSTFLLAMAHNTLGSKSIAVTSRSIVHPRRERMWAERFTEEAGIRHIFIDQEVQKIPAFVSNTPDRCYYCKKDLMNRIKEMAVTLKIAHVAHGANMDDLKDYRPGFKATKETGVLAPLMDVQLHKEEIRFLSKKMGLKTWDKPAMACLASRIPYHEKVTEEKIAMVAEAEDFLAAQGFKQYRVRHHGSVSRIELEAQDIPGIIDGSLKKAVISKFREIGFLHVAVDLEGYRTGSLNRELEGIE